MTDASNPRRKPGRPPMAGKRNDESRLRGGARRGSLTASAILSVLFLVAAFSFVLNFPHATHAQNGPVLDAPALTADDAKANRVEISWSAVDGAARYELWRLEKGADGWILIGDALTGTTHTDTDVEAGKTYFYTARGLTADGAEGAWSDYSSEEARATVAAPPDGAVGRVAGLQEPTPTPTAPATPTATHTAMATSTKTPMPMPTATPTATPTSTPAPAGGSLNDDSEGGGGGASTGPSRCRVRRATYEEDLARCQRIPHPTATPTITPTITPTPSPTPSPTPGPPPPPTHTSTPPSSLIVPPNY